MLGLKYGTVALSSHDHDWAREFLEEEARLRAALPAGCMIEHIGSTAVPELSAKPILDIVVGCPSGVVVSDVIATIESSGYLYRGDAGTVGGHILVRESQPAVRTHHVHIVALNDPQWRAYLALREWLRAHPEARAVYERVKQRLAADHRDDRRAYTRGKGEAIAGLLRDAVGPVTPSAADAEPRNE